MKTSLRIPLYVLFLLSGLAALVYQQVWVRQLGEVFGHTVYAISTVIATYMAGLALGSWLTGIWTGWRKQPITYYVIVELGIGISGALVTLLLPHLSVLYTPFYEVLLAKSTLLLNLVRMLISALVLVTPTILMGMTLPLLSEIIFDRRENIGREFSNLYGFNTLGGAIGVLLTGFVLFEKVGVSLSAVIPVLLNLMIAGSVFLLSRRFGLRLQLEKMEGVHEQVEKITISARLLTIILFINGFSALGLEVFWSRVFAFYLGNSTYGFTLVLFMILFGIAIGAEIVSRFADRLKNPLLFLAVLQAGIALSLVVTLQSISGVFQEFMLQDSIEFEPYITESLYKSAIILLPPSILMGISLPLINKVLLPRLSDASIRVGKLYALNTIGGILGSLLSGFFFIELFGVGLGISLFALLYLVLAFVLGVKAFQGRGRILLLGGFTAVLVVLVLQALTVHDSKLMTAQDRLLSDGKVVFYEEGADATVTVYNSSNSERVGRTLTVNGSVIGGDGRAIMRKQAILAHMPMLLRPEMKSAYVVGLGTGVTLGQLLLHPLERVVIAEISRPVIRASHEFVHVSGLDYDDPRLHWVADDGKVWLQHTKERFDLITSDTMLRRGSAGNGRMYSLDYYQMISDHLTDSGLYVQWVPTYLPLELHKMIVRTVLDVFPHVVGWYLGEEVLVLMGSQQPIELPFDSATQRMQDQAISDMMVSSDFPTLTSMIGTALFDSKALETYSGSGNFNTIEHPIVEFRVPRLGSDSRHVARVLAVLGREIKSPLQNDDLRIMGLSELQEELIEHQYTAYKNVYQSNVERFAGRTIEARKLLVDVLNEWPHDVHALRYLGISPAIPDNYLKAKRFQEAAYIARGKHYNELSISLIQMALDINPDDLNNLTYLYQFRYLDGEYEEALRVLKHALELDPDNLRLSTDLAYLMEQMSRKE